MKKRQKITHYDILGVSPHATDSQVRASYRMLARRWHPDLNPQNREKAAYYFDLLHKAYMNVKTKPQRKAYNRYLLNLIHKKDAPNDNNKRKNQGTLSAIKGMVWSLTAKEKKING